VPYQYRNAVPDQKRQQCRSSVSARPHRLDHSAMAIPTLALPLQMGPITQAQARRSHRAEKASQSTYSKILQLNGQRDMNADSFMRLLNDGMAAGLSYTATEGIHNDP